MRIVFGLIVGLTLGFLTITVVQVLGHTVYPVPSDLDLSDSNAVAAYARTLPVGALLFVVTSYLVGTFAGAFAATKVGRDVTMRSAWITGGITALAGLANFVNIPHPAWMVVLSFAAFGLGAALGGKAALRGPGAHPDP